MKRYLYLTFIAAAICMSNCASSSFPKNDEGVVTAQPAQMGKDALRLKGKVLGKTKVGERMSYRVQVLEIIQYGSTFAHAEPRVSEIVMLYAPMEAKLAKGAEVIFDALSPIDRGEGMLELNMVIQ